MSENAGIAERTQEKFDFYLLALTLTILGLSIPTARFGQGYASDLAELAGWLALLGSGLLGFARLERIPSLSRMIQAQLEREGAVRQAQAATRPGGTVRIIGRDVTEVSLEDFTIRTTDIAELAKGHAERLEDRIGRRYRLQKWAFVLGLLLLMCARGLPPAARLAGYQLVGLAKPAGSP